MLFRSEVADLHAFEHMTNHRNRRKDPNVVALLSEFLNKSVHEGSTVRATIGRIDGGGDEDLQGAKR